MRLLNYVNKPLVVLLGALCIVASISAYTNPVSADTVSEIQAKIAENNAKIEALKKEIGQYSTLLDSTSKQAQTLANSLKALELSQKKLEASLKLTTKNISKANLTLSQLSRDITATEQDIAKASAAIAENIRQTQIAESQSLIENFLNNRSISETWDYVNAVHSLQTHIKNKLDDLQTLKNDLKSEQEKTAVQKANLISYQKNLSGQKQAVAATADEKAKLLKDTKGKEEAYKDILTEKIAQEAAYEKELFDYESRLQAVIDPGSIPNARHGVLSWPLEKVRITQYFGKTVSAQRLYVSGSHNGIDFGVATGNEVYAALSGTVTDTEASKSRAGCQYGKFVLLKHPNGLSTIYGHLSVVLVKPGDTVSTGDLIGYSGATGYATGPHLHFGLYISSGIKIVDSAALVKPPAVSNCAGIKTVAAPTNAYLDPMAYFPTL